MLDVDLAKLYGVTTKALNQAMQRNKNRFPADFAYRLTGKELDDLRSQIVTTSKGQPGTRIGNPRQELWNFSTPQHFNVSTALQILPSNQRIKMSVRVSRPERSPAC